MHVDDHGLQRRCVWCAVVRSPGRFGGVGRGMDDPLALPIPRNSQASPWTVGGAEAPDTVKDMGVLWDAVPYIVDQPATICADVEGGGHTAEKSYRTTSAPVVCEHRRSLDDCAGGRLQQQQP